MSSSLCALVKELCGGGEANDASLGSAHGRDAQAGLTALLMHGALELCGVIHSERPCITPQFFSVTCCGLAWCLRCALL
jgi:hypothetical protein